MNVGLNLSSNTDWQTSRIWLDLQKVFRAWGSPTKPYEPGAFTLSPDGYPLIDFGGFAELHNYPSGLYLFSYSGSGLLTWTAGAVGDTRTDPKAKSGTVVINGDSGNLSFRVTGVNPADPFRDFSVRRTATGTFDPAFLDSLKPFPVLRFMDWQHTNYTRVREWADRPLPQHQQTISPGDPLGKGVALEYILELCRLTGASPWLCVPPMASDAYVARMANLVVASLPAGRPVYLEIANEVWNGLFPCHLQLIADAKANLALDANDPNARLFQHVAWRLAKAVGVFRDAGVNVVGVLATQADNPTGWLAEQGLDFLKRKAVDTRGPLVGVIAYGDYFLTNDNFSNVGDGGAASAMSRSLGWVQTYRKLADKYGVPAVAVYEGGQGLIGADPLKLAAQTSTAMGDLYRRVIRQFFDNAGPGAIYGAFAYPDDWGDGSKGYWGLSRKLGDMTPKYQAVIDAAGGVVPPVPPPPVTYFTGKVTYVYEDGRLTEIRPG